MKTNNVTFTDIGSGTDLVVLLNAILVELLLILLLCRTDTCSVTGTNPRTGSGTDSGAESGTSYRTESGTAIDNDFSADTAVYTGTDVGTETGIDAGTDVGTETGTDVGNGSNAAGLSKRFRVARVAKTRLTPIVASIILIFSSLNFLILTILKSSEILVSFPPSIPVAIIFYVHEIACDLFCKSTDFRGNLQYRIRRKKSPMF